MTLFIGLGHYKRTGKDSFANFLIQEIARFSPQTLVVKRSFAWKLKQICHELYGWAGLREPEFYETKEGEALREIVLPALGKSPRQIWVDFGTDAVRDRVYPDTWRDFVFKADQSTGGRQPDVMIVPDVRFPNETAEFEVRNGILIKVVRPGYGPGRNRPDRELLGFDRWTTVIGEEGTMESLHRWAIAWANWIGAIRGGWTAQFPSRSPDEIKAALAVENVEPWTPDNE